jgi:hypothetical protein
MSKKHISVDIVIKNIFFHNPDGNMRKHVKEKKLLKWKK